jgi:ATP-dependent helicase/nuclease subunit A
MAEADLKGLLFRERPFTYAVSAAVFDPSLPSDESVLVQGIIDAWFREGDRLVLVDYKTDRVAEGLEADLVRKYRIQLACYKEALEAGMQMPVGDTFIYSFALGKGIPI